MLFDLLFLATVPAPTANPTSNEIMLWIQAGIAIVAFLGSLFAAGLWRSVGRLESTTSQVKDSLDKYGEEVEENSKSIATIKTRLKTVEDGVVSNSERITALNTKVDLTRDDSGKTHESLAVQIHQLIGMVKGLSR